MNIKLLIKIGSLKQEKDPCISTQVYNLIQTGNKGRRRQRRGEGKVLLGREHSMYGGPEAGVWELRVAGKLEPSSYRGLGGQ